MARIILRFFDDAGQPSIAAASADDPMWAPAPRRLRVADNESPLPPAEEAAAWADLPHATLCDSRDARALDDLRNAVLLGDPDVGDVEMFGGYLFAVLLGGFWDAIATRFTEQPIDLELTFDAAVASLQAWPWELAFLNGRPLVVESKQPVSFTRVIGRPATRVVIDFPLRLLFIVGRTDPRLRPGAEYLGIIRGLATSFRDNGEDVSAMVSVRSLIDASRDDIETLCGAWSPHVVHVVACGEIVGHTPMVQLTARKANTLLSDPVDAATLCGLLQGHTGQSRLPGLVVVNASQPTQPGVHLSFAASLVERGIPAAIGMAGEVASGACRVFTQALYRALAGHRPLPNAVALGQRAAALHYERYARSVDWARPALFVSRDASLAFSVEPAKKVLASVVAKVRGTRPVFCDRYVALDAFSRFSLRADKGGEQVLAFESSDGADKPLPNGKFLSYQIGKTLLLGEIQWHALLDGFLPCFVRTDDGHEAPNNLLLFALRLPELFDERRKEFGLEPRVNSRALTLARIRLGHPAPEFDPAAEDQFSTMRDLTVAAFAGGVGSGHNGLSPASVAGAMRGDIERLVADVRTKCPHVRGVLIMLDDFDRYVGFADLLLNQVGDHGLGSAQAPAPIVLTYSARRNHGGHIRKMLTLSAMDVRKRTVHRTLEPFSEGAEAQLAYGHYLLSKRLAPARQRSERERVEKLFKFLHKKAEGVPSFLHLITDVIDYAAEQGQLVASDDDIIFEQMSRE